MSSQRRRWSPSNKRASRAPSLHVSLLRERPRVTDRSTRSRDVRAPWAGKPHDSHFRRELGGCASSERYLPLHACRLPLAYSHTPRSPLRSPTNRS